MSIWKYKVWKLKLNLEARPIIINSKVFFHMAKVSDQVLVLALSESIFHIFQFEMANTSEKNPENAILAN